MRLPSFSTFTLVIFFSSLLSALASQQKVEIRLRGLDDEPALAELLHKISITEELGDSPAQLEAIQMRRAKQDATRFKQALRSKGYYSAEVTIQPIQYRDAGIRVIFEVTLNQTFVFGKSSITVPQPENTSVPLRIPSAKELGITTNAIAAFAPILNAEKILARQLAEQGYPRAKTTTREVIADFARNEVELRLSADAGPFSLFGPIEFEGLKKVKLKYVERQIPWKEDDPFRPSDVRLFRQRLNDSGLFASIFIREADELNEQGHLAQSVSFIESRRYSIGLRAGYNTEYGIGGGIRWQNSNLSGVADKLFFDLLVAENKITGETEYNYPDFKIRGQDLILNLSLRQEEPPAYDALSLKFMGGLSRKVKKRLRISVMGTAKAAQVEQFGSEEEYGYLGLPIDIRWDGRDDAADPHFGPALLLSGDNMYFIDDDNNRQFFRIKCMAMQVLPVFKTPDTTFMARVQFGAITGTDNMFEIPADERFYAGGSDTIRGYSYQSAGPLQDDSPTGGQSAFTVSGELFARLLGPVGLVFFIDGGNVYPENTPDFSQELLWGAGSGLRVVSPVGAIGLEVGFPLNKRKIDKNQQIYITIGYSF